MSGALVIHSLNTLRHPCLHPYACRNPLRLVVSNDLSIEEAVSDAQSFEEFFEAESRAMFRRLCLVTGDRHDAEEVLQDAF